jgi:hypothetical protein
MLNEISLWHRGDLLPAESLRLLDTLISVRWRQNLGCMMQPSFGGHAAIPLWHIAQQFPQPSLRPELDLGSVVLGLVDQPWPVPLAPAGARSSKR